MVRGSNKKGQIRAIHSKGNYVKKAVIRKSDLDDARNRITNSNSRIVGSPKVFRKYILKPVTKISREILIYAVLTVLSTTIANPAPLIFYQIYKKSMFSYHIWKKVQNSNYGGLAKDFSKIEISKISDSMTDTIAIDVTKKTEETGYFKEISRKTGFAEPAAFLLFHSSLKKGLSTGSDSLTDFVVEGMT